MVAAPGGPNGCQGTNNPMGQGNNTWRAGLPVQYSSCVMRSAVGNTHWACQVLTLMHPTLHASSALCGVPLLRLPTFMP